MLKVTLIALMVEMKGPMTFPQWAVEDCFTLQYVHPAGVSAVAQILMSNSHCQFGAQQSKVRVVVNAQRLMTILTRAPIYYGEPQGRGSSRRRSLAGEVSGFLGVSTETWMGWVHQGKPETWISEASAGSVLHKGGLRAAPASAALPLAKCY